MPRHSDKTSESKAQPQDQNWSTWADDLASSAKTKAVAALNTPEGQAAAGIVAVATLIAAHGKLNPAGERAMAKAATRLEARMESWMADVDRPTWIKKAEELTLMKRYPGNDYEMVNKARLSWHSRPEIVDDAASPWISRTTTRNPNSSEILKNTGVTAIAKAKGIDVPVELGVSSKGSIIEKLNEKTGDYLRVNERTESSLRLGIWSFDTPAGVTSKEFFLGNGWRADRPIAQATLRESTARSGNTMTDLLIQSEQGYNRRIAWGDATGVNRRLDVDFAPKQLKVTLRTPNGEPEEKVYPRGSLIHTVERFNQWTNKLPKNEGVVSDALTQKLLTDHVFADGRLLSRL